MLKTLKITSILVASAALAVVVVLVIFGLKGDVAVEQYLDLPSAVEKFRESAKPADGQQDTTSPLVNEALAFVLRIDPPPQIKTTRPPKTSRPRTTTGPKPQPPRPQPKVEQVNVKFKLVATCRYDDQPEKSLALLDLTSKGKKWFRQGEEIGRLVIQEIKDGSIVLYKDGRQNSEISVPKTASRIRSLLKSDQDASIAEPAVTTTYMSQVNPETVIPSKKTASKQHEPAVGRPERASDYHTQRPAATTATRPSTAIDPATKRPSRRVPSRRVASPKPVTPKERKDSLDESISGIKGVMGRTKGDSVEKDMEIWQKLLDRLEKDKAEIEKEESETKKEKK